MTDFTTSQPPPRYRNHQQSLFGGNMAATYAAAELYRTWLIAFQHAQNQYQRDVINTVTSSQGVPNDGIGAEIGSSNAIKKSAIWSPGLDIEKMASSRAQLENDKESPPEETKPSEVPVDGT